MRNHNGLLGRMPGVDGLKTGYTNASGFNLAVSAVRDGRRLIAVVMGGSSTAARDNNAQDLLLVGFDVMSRRARGEKITVAQNLFEPEPSGPIMRPSVEQGDGEQDGLKIELASAPIPLKTTRVAVVEPEKTSLRNTRKGDKKKAGEWTVQVGAFKSKSDAKEQLSFVKQRFGKHFDDAPGVVTPREKGTYRSLFNGFNERSAKAACSALKAKRMACQVISPA
jgi:D-alanyl-D-alanine carboxypeptidase (penicillin-binding protein 5/6)